MKKNYILTILFALFGISQSWAQLPYNTTYTKSHFDDNKVTVISNDVNWDNKEGVRLGNATWGGFNWDDKYIIIALDQQSIPYQLNFKYKVSSTAVSDPKWYVAESSDNENWTEIWAATPATTSIITVSTDWIDVDPVTLSKSTKYVKICYSGNFAGYLSDIIVSDQAYINDPKVGDDIISSLDFGTKTISSGKEEKSFDIEWCNVDEFNVTSNNTAFFAVSPASFGGKAKYGTQTVTVSYDRDKAIGTHNGTITITNGSVTKTVTVSGTTSKRDQVIHWNKALSDVQFTMNAEEELTGEEIATADNEEAEVTFSSDNEDVIAVSADGKTLYAIENGTAKIKVFATGNDVYNEGKDSTIFTVTSKKKQTIIWDQNFMGLKTNADPNTIELEATATSGGEVTFALEDGSDDCVTLSGSTLTITGKPGVAYIIANQAGGEINGEEWIAISARKQVKVRDPHAACDEYALADASYTFSKGDKSMVNKEFNLEGKPTQLTFYAKRGGLKYIWESQTPLYIDQYANFGSGLEWKQVESVKPSENGDNFGPFALDETATKIRFRTAEYAEQAISNISVPRKKEMVVSETAIDENAERNVKWSKIISVTRSNVDVVDINVESSDAECPFEVSKTSIGIDCSDRTTETFEVFITPKSKGAVYTGTITISDGKAVPTTHVIDLTVTAVAFNQSITGFELPESCLTTDEVEIPAEVAATSGLEVVFLSSDSTIAYVENKKLVILKAGTVDIIAYQAGDDRYNETSEKKTIEIKLTPVTILEAPTASAIKAGETLSESVLTGGSASVEGSFAWQDPETKPATGKVAYAVVFTPKDGHLYDTAVTEVEVEVARNTQTITWDEVLPLINAGDTIELHATASSELTVTFTSSNTEIAYYDAEKGGLIALAPGTVTISAVQEGNDDFEAAEPVDRVINIQDPGDTREEQVIIWEDQVLVVDMAEGAETVVLTAYLESGLDITYESSDETIAKVGKEQNELELWIDIIVPVRAGKVRITASREGDDTFKPAVPVTKEFEIINSDDPETAVENVENAKRATKILLNGQIFILRDGKIYDLRGQRVE